MPTLKLRIQGLRHEDEREVARRIRVLPGVFSVALDHANECARIDFEDEDISLAEICAAFRGLGYRVDLAG